MNRTFQSAAISLLLAVSLSACSVIPIKSTNEHFSTQKYCNEAYEQGWCSDMCSRHQPIGCDKHPKLISCSDFMCMFEDKDGNLIFAAHVNDDGTLVKLPEIKPAAKTDKKVNLKDDHCNSPYGPYLDCNVPNGYINPGWPW